LQTYLEWRSRQDEIHSSETGFVPQDARRDAQDDEMRQPDTHQ
jgi:hypothetical protein